MLNRKPVGAGGYYESSFNKLDKQIRGSFFGKLGPGEDPGSRKDKAVRAVVAPHSNYKLCGQCAAWPYKEIAESRFPEFFVVLGVDHGKIGADFSMHTFSDWEMPFGIVKVEKEAGQDLKKYFPELKNEVGAHLTEHSVEVQLPFLQYANRDKLNEVKILPILVKSDDIEKCRKFGEALAKLGLERDFCVVVSTDFTHYGKSYGNVPYVYSVKENIRNGDLEVIEYVKNFDSGGLLNFVKKDKMNICGVGGLIVMMEYLKIVGCRRKAMLQYYLSGDVNGDYNDCIGFGAMTFE